VGTVLVARALAVVPVVTALDRFAVIPRVGLRNEAVLVWGGLRGAVALALALALPTALPERDMLIAMTGGVVLATLLLNATTISRLVHWLGLDEPSRTERFLLTGARLSAIEAARDRLGVLDMDDATVEAELEQAATRALEELQRVELSDREERSVVGAARVGRRAPHLPASQ
jgi:monovalent cation:H+ antiporter, CPA1 family